MPGHTVSIVIPVFNRVELTIQCLTALAAVTQGVDYEVVIVDNGSTDGTPEFLRCLGGDVQVVRNERNLGFAPACNQGARAARGRYVVFLNNDTIPLDGWLLALVDEVETHPEVAVVGSKLLYADGTIQHAGVAFARLWFTPYHIYQHVPAHAPFVNRRRELQGVTAACMLVRRDAFEAVGGFDEGYRNGFEDIDLCLRIGERGGRVVYQPRSVLLHLESQSPGRKDHDVANLERLRRRWAHEWWREDEDDVYVEDGLAYHVSFEGGQLRYLLEPLLDPAERRRWEIVAETQRAARRGDLEAVHAGLRRADEWPADVWVLRWGAAVCTSAGIPRDARPFWRRIVLLDATAARAGLPPPEERDDDWLEETVSRIEAMVAAGAESARAVPAAAPPRVTSA